MGVGGGVGEREIGKLGEMGLWMGKVLGLVAVGRREDGRGRLFLGVMGMIRAVNAVGRVRKLGYRVRELEVKCLYVVYLFRSKYYELGLK